MDDAALNPSVRLWDLPVRLVHWSFAALVPALWWTAEKGDLDLHLTLGLIMLGLVWAAHIGVDRALGLGLKYGAGFGFTHLGRIGGALSGS